MLIVGEEKEAEDTAFILHSSRCYAFELLFLTCALKLHSQKSLFSLSGYFLSPLNESSRREDLIAIKLMEQFPVSPPAFVPTLFYFKSNLGLLLPAFSIASLRCGFLQ